MLFKVSPDIFKNYPQLKIGIVLVLDINNKKNEKIEKLLKEQQDILQESFLNLDVLSKHKHILSWQDAYIKFGANPKKYLSSVENLVTRILSKKNIKSINPLVDLYNIISLKYLLPLGGEDLDKIKGNIELTIAQDNEKSVILLGESESKAPKKGEVIYKDDNGAIVRRFNWKEAERTKLTEDTKNAILFVEALGDFDVITVQAATHELANLIKEYCGGEISIDFVDVINPSIEIQKNEKYVSRIKKWEFTKLPFDIYKQIKNPEELTTEDLNIQNSKEYEIRVEKVKKLRELGIEPWPESPEITNSCKEVLDDFEKGNEKSVYTIAGRIVSRRLHGKTAFLDILDKSGKLQVYIQKDKVGSLFDLLTDYIDIGDVISCSGTSFKTKMGEITLNVDKFTLLSKCLYPLPEKFHGLSDIEIKYRQRYLDLITSNDSRDRFKKRSAIVKYIRDFLDNHGYIEVETPMLHPIAGGAAAKPFITHHNALNTDFYLRIAPELYLKRLVVGGFEKVYEINRNFRNEGISTRHNPEFTMLEFYTAYQNYNTAMNFVEELLRYAAQHACKSLKFEFGNYILDFSVPFERISIYDSVKLHLNLTNSDLKEESIDKTLQKNCVKSPSKEASLNEKIYALFEDKVEQKLIQPTFIIDFPIEVSPLSKRDMNNPKIASRFELFIAGMELSNGFNELNDPFDQAQRFYDQLKSREAGNEEAHQFDADYVTALEYGLPPTAGVGIGIDRLVMLLTNTTSIKEVILFPTLKKKIEE